MTPLILGVCATNRLLGIAFVCDSAVRYERGHDLRGRDRVEATRTIIAELLSTYATSHLALVGRPDDPHLLEAVRRVARSRRVPIRSYRRDQARDGIASDKTYAGLSKALVARYPELTQRSLPARRFRGLISDEERGRQPVLLAVAGAVLFLDELQASSL